MNTSAEKKTLAWLQAAAAWRFFSLCLRLPARPVRAALAAMARELPKHLSQLATELAAVPIEDSEAEFHRVLGAGGIPACESSYDDNALAGRGPLLADIRGFYEAFAYRPQELPAEVPDHIAVELDFLSYLAVKIAFALHEGKAEESRIAREAYEHFLDEHVRAWVERFHARLQAAASPVYFRVSACLNDLLSSPRRAQIQPAQGRARNKKAAGASRPKKRRARKPHPAVA